jgi:TRAP-type C4-dicarboxylate transport system permease small subunit
LHTLLRVYARLLAGLGWIERVLLVLLIANIVVNITAQVISRYLFNQPLVWVEEIATYSFIWATFLGASLGLKHDRHIRIETFVGRLPPRGAALMRALVMALIILLFLVVIGPVLTNLSLEMRRTSIALPLPVPMGWFFSMPLLVGVLSMLVTAFYRLLAELWMAASGQPPLPILADIVDEEDLEAERALAGETA